MTDLDKGLVALWAADAGVQAALATGDARSIFDGVTPPDEAAYPCFGYSFVGGTAAPTFDTAGMQRSRLQLDCWGTSKKQVVALANALIALMNGYQGLLADGTTIGNAWLINPPGVDFFSGESRQRRRMLEFYLLYTFTS